MIVLELNKELYDFEYFLSFVFQIKYVVFLLKNSSFKPSFKKCFSIRFFKSIFSNRLIFLRIIFMIIYFSPFLLLEVTTPKKVHSNQSFDTLLEHVNYLHGKNFEKFQTFS